MSGAAKGSAEALAEAFWRFSLAFYARPGVADALLRLQDEAAANVNLVLFVLWAGGVRGIRLRPEDLAVARQRAEPLDRDVVAPLRALRRKLKAMPEADIQALRRRVAALELAAERQVQARLAAMLPTPAAGSGNPDAAAANLALVVDPASPWAQSLREALAAFPARR